MKTVRREKSAELVKAGWVEETYWIWILAWGKWRLWEKEHSNLEPGALWLPAPTADEIAEGVSFEDLVCFYADNTPEATAQGWRFYEEFAHWLYPTRNSADAMADVWIKTNGKELITK